MLVSDSVIKRKRFIMITKSYVCGFAFSEDGDLVYLIEKKRPNWQLGCLNGIGGGVDIDEEPINAMVREFEEETGVTTKQDEWILLETHDNCLDDVRVIVNFYAIKLSELGHNTPCTKTDEIVLRYRWKDTTPNEWLLYRAIDNIPYLVAKGHCFLFTPEIERMRKQNQQDSRTG